MNGMTKIEFDKALWDSANETAIDGSFFRTGWRICHITTSPNRMRTVALGAVPPHGEQPKISIENFDTRSRTYAHIYAEYRIDNGKVTIMDAELSGDSQYLHAEFTCDQSMIAIFPEIVQEIIRLAIAYHTTNKSHI